MAKRATKPCNSTCPKCGSDVVIRDMRAKGEYLHTSYGKHKWISAPWVKDVHYSSYEFTRDCIEHHCRDCHYEWCTEPLKAA